MQYTNWYFHEQAEFLPVEVEGVEFCAVFDAPSEWEPRLIAASFMKTEQAWVLAKPMNEKIARYLSPDIELREIEPGFFDQGTPEPEPENRLFVPKEILSQLEVFAKGNTQGVEAALQGVTGDQWDRLKAREIVGQAQEGVLDDATAVVYQLAYLRLDEQTAMLPQVKAFAEQLKMEQIVGFDWQLRKGELLAQKGTMISVDGQKTGRLAGDFHEKDPGAWLLKEPIVWIQDVYATPNYEWATSEELKAYLQPEQAQSLQEQPQEQPAPQQEAEPQPQAQEQAQEETRPQPQPMQMGLLNEANQPEPVESQEQAGTQPDTQAEAEPQALEQEDEVQAGAEPEQAVEPEPEPQPEQQAEPPAQPEAAQQPQVDDTPVSGEVDFVQVQAEQQQHIEFDAEQYREQVLESLADLPSFDLTRERMDEIYRKEVGRVAQDVFGREHDQKIRAYFVGGKVFVEDRLALLRYHGDEDEAYKGIVDVTQHCPELEEISGALSQAFDSLNESVSFGLSCQPDVVDDKRLDIGIYPYLANGKGAFSKEALDFKYYRAMGVDQNEADDKVEAVLANNLSGNFNGGHSHTVSRSFWYNDDHTLGEVVVEKISELESGRRWSKAIMDEQIRAGGLDENRQYLDSARLAGIADLGVWGDRDYPNYLKPKIAEHLTALWTNDQLLDMQHFVFGLGSRSGERVGLNVYSVSGGFTRRYTNKHFDDTLELVKLEQTDFFDAEEPGSAAKSFGLRFNFDSDPESALLNVPRLYYVRMAEHTKFGSEQAFREVGLPWQMGNGNFSLGKLHDSATLALTRGGQLDRVFGFFSKNQYAQSWRSARECQEPVAKNSEALGAGGFNRG